MEINSLALLIVLAIEETVTISFCSRRIGHNVLLTAMTQPAMNLRCALDGRTDNLQTFFSDVVVKTEISSVRLGIKFPLFSP